MALININLWGGASHSVSSCKSNGSNLILYALLTNSLLFSLSFLFLWASRNAFPNEIRQLGKSSLGGTTTSKSKNECGKIHNKVCRNESKNETQRACQVPGTPGIPRTLDRAPFLSYSVVDSSSHVTSFILQHNERGKFCDFTAHGSGKCHPRVHRVRVSPALGETRHYYLPENRAE